MNYLEGFAWGLFGGFLAELLGFWKLRCEASETWPSWLKTKTYWVITFGMVAAGGGVVIMYLRSHIELSPLLAVNVGASAPLIIGALVSQVPKLPPGKVD